MHRIGGTGEQERERVSQRLQTCACLEGAMGVYHCVHVGRVETLRPYVPNHGQKFSVALHVAPSDLTKAMPAAPVVAVAICEGATFRQMCIGPGTGALLLVSNPQSWG